MASRLSRKVKAESNSHRASGRASERVNDLRRGHSELGTRNPELGTRSRSNGARRRPFIIGWSDVHGRGAFATEWIPTGTRLIEYTGERITEEEADARYDDEDESRPHHTFLFSLDNGEVVDATYGGNVSRWINHSCDPNCEAVIEDDRIFIESVRDIASSEELSYDYAFVLEERHTPALKARHPCYCGASNCRGTILAQKRRR